jgi:arylsulfatase
VPIPPAPGKSLLPAFPEDIAIERDSLWWFHEGNRAIRVGDFKLVAAKNEPWELYDLSDDRAESKNLITQHPDKAAHLIDQWQQQLKQISEIATLTTPKKKPEKKRKRKQQPGKKPPTPLPAK